MSDGRTVVFYDKENKLDRAAKLFPGAERRFSPDAPKESELRSLSECTVVFMLENGKLRDAAENCRLLQNADVFVVPSGIGYTPDPIKIDCSKTRLNYVETEISRVCNLNCRGCCDFINLKVKEEPFYDFELFCRDISRLKELFWGIAQIRIMGGEPFLNTRVADYVEKARALFPDSDLRVVTNGLLLTKTPEETLKRIAAASCSLDISAYPPTWKQKKDISRLLDSLGVKYSFSVPMVVFFKNVLEKPVDDPAPAHRNCIFSHCHMLGNGRITPCSFAFCIYRFNRHFGTSYPETDFVDIHDPSADGRRIYERLSTPHEFCKYCGAGMTPILWKGRNAPADARREDWLIADTFLNTKVAPAIQGAARKSAVALRSKIRDKQD